MAANQDLFQQHIVGPFMHAPAPAQNPQHIRNLRAFCRTERIDPREPNLEYLYSQYMQRQAAIVAAKQAEMIRKCVLQPVQSFPASNCFENWMCKDI